MQPKPPEFQWGEGLRPGADFFDTVSDLAQADSSSSSDPYPPIDSEASFLLSSPGDPLAAEDPKAAQSSVSIPAEERQHLRLYREMLRIRCFEEMLQKLLAEGKVGGTTHLCIGQEAVPVGVSSLLTQEDLVVSTHRGHGHLLAKGARADRALAEIAGRETGYCKGKGGSQHVAVPEIGHMGSNGITGGGLPIGTGLGLAQRMLATGRCVVVYLGDGAADTGNFHESLNLASLWKLPVVYALENNLYAMSTPVSKSSACASFADWASRYSGLEARRIDGNDVLAVAEAFAPLLDRARRGEGPALIECLTYRQSGHSKSDARVYRSREEEAEWRAKDPLEVLKAKAGLRDAAVEEVAAEVAAEMAEAKAFALNSPAGDRSLALAHMEIREPEALEDAPEQRIAEGSETSLTEALREVLRQELARDPATLLIGEDIGVYGGAFGVTRGLLEEFGQERVRETPICESGFVGLSVGAATGGLRPIAELMFGDFTACCMDALVNHAAKFHYMYAGALDVPFTLRMPVGRRHGYGATHSQSLEAWFCHVPGMQVLFPSNVADAVGLLRTAIRSDVPVLFLEHKLLYPSRGVMPSPNHCVPFGRARVVHPGLELSMVSYGHSVGTALEAIRHLEKRGHSVELLDLRSLAPFDRDAVIQSVRKTGRMLFVQEASTIGGVADRVIADVLPDVFAQLHAPIEKLGMAHVPFPSSPQLEELVLPSVPDIVRAALPLLTEY
ncbi:MAG: dehydrogenase [Planctomycetota bacterium]|nr:MAG: dehydrogenase [Planctomycetota bacterium]